MRAYGQKLVKFCTLTHTLTHAAKLVVRMYTVKPRYNTVVRVHKFKIAL